MGRESKTEAILTLPASTLGLVTARGTTLPALLSVTTGLRDETAAAGTRFRGQLQPLHLPSSTHRRRAGPRQVKVGCV